MERSMGEELDEDGLYELEEIDMGPNWDDEYDRYRDDWSESLLLDVKKLFTEYVKDKHGYYFGADERFVEHVICCLKEAADVELIPGLVHIGAKKREAPKVEYVESFDELKEVKVMTNEEVPINIKP
jgi:hypothetical protein